MKEAKTFAPKEVLRRDWMFKLVGTETFSVGKNKAACSIKIEPVGGFSYEYSLEVIELVGLGLTMVAPGGRETVQEVH